MKILLISGFLGAGKTTFIKAMAKATGREFVIVENEFSEENIDSKLLKKDDPLAQMKIFELSEGCICCSLNLDFSYSVLTIANTLNPDYLIVEPSGVAQPGNIVSDLEKIAYEKIRLLAPITVVDADNFQIQNRDFKNYFQDQVLTAGTIVLSKSENLNKMDFLKIKKELDIAKDVHFPIKHYSYWSKEEWLQLFEQEFTGEDIKKVGTRFSYKALKREADQDLENMTLKNVHFVNPDQCYNFLEEILNNKYGNIIRAKGFVKIKDEYIHVELVEKQFSMIGLSKEETKAIMLENKKSKQENMVSDYELSKLIIIGKNLKKQSIRLNFLSPGKKLKTNEQTN